MNMLRTKYLTCPINVGRSASPYYLSTFSLQLFLRQTSLILSLLPRHVLRSRTERTLTMTITKWQN